MLIEEVTERTAATEKARGSTAFGAGEYEVAVAAFGAALSLEAERRARALGDGDYEAAAAILRDLGVSRVRLLTNNPEKCEALEAMGSARAARTRVYAGLPTGES